MNERLITLKEAAFMLGGFCERTVRRMIARGELPKPVRIASRLVFPVSVIQNYIKKLTSTDDGGTAA